MNIAIVTFCLNGNYGSELQAVALNRYCSLLGHKVVFLKFGSKNKIDKIVHHIKHVVVDKFCEVVNSEYRSMKLCLKNNSQSQQKMPISLKKKIINQAKEEIKIKHVSSNKYCELYDCYICGSDQIWSPLILPIKRENYLSTVHKTKKIAYAPSFGVDLLPEFFKRKVKKYLCDFKYLSIRENSGKELLNNDFGLDANTVLDPTLLMGKAEWDELCKKHNKVLNFDNYVLCYFLSEVPEQIINYIDKYSCGRRIICLVSPSMANRFKTGEFYPADQYEFIYLIKNADFIFTDSFHGTAFSIIYEKNFLTFARNNSFAAKQTGRIKSLFDNLGLEEHFIDGSNRFNINGSLISNIDYIKISSNLLKLQKMSKEYLNQALYYVERGAYE